MGLELGSIRKDCPKIGDIELRQTVGKWRADCSFPRSKPRWPTRARHACFILGSSIWAGAAVLVCIFEELIAQRHLDWSAQSVLQLRLERSVPGERLEMIPRQVS